MKKAEKHLPEIRKLFIEQYPDYFGAKAGANSLAAVIDDEVEWRPSNGCHGALNELVDDGCQGLFSTLWCRYEDLYEAALDYWGYLLGPKGPWSKYMQDIVIIKDDKDRPKAFGTFNMDQYATAWVPCMMQCRVPQESSNKLRSYWFFRRSGMDEPTSLYLSEHLQLHITGYFSQVTTDYVHAFKWDSPGIDIERLRNCDPIIINKQKLEDFNSWGPVNAAWATEAKMKSSISRYYDEDDVIFNKPKPFNFDIIKGTVSYKGKMPLLFNVANDNSPVFKDIGFKEPKELYQTLKEANSWYK